MSQPLAYFKGETILPLILTKKQKVLIVGAGRACEIKLKVLSKHPTEITIVAKEFLCNIDKSIKKIKKSFEELDYNFFLDFDLIYIAIPLKETKIVEELAKVKMVNVLSNPKLSNFIHPCSRDDEDIIVSVANLKKANPKRACSWADRFIEYKNES